MLYNKDSLKKKEVIIMPHVGGGGGGHSGGFHSGGSSFSHSSTTSIPRRDIYGHAHSTYYRRPGFYYRNMYVPYSRVNRTYYAIRSYLIFLIAGILFFVGAIGTLFIKDSDSLTNYSLSRYEELYTKDSNYEYNILIEIVAYDNQKEIDYLPIVGDDVSNYIDSTFGNQYSTFGRPFANALDKTSDKVNNLYSCINTALKDVNNDSLMGTIAKHSGNTYDTKIVNNTGFDLGSDAELKEAMNLFYDQTGYNITVDVSKYFQAYAPHWGLFALLAGIGALLFFAGVSSMYKSIQAVRKINQEEKNGDLSNLEKYYEGEVKFEDQIKLHPMDEPYDSSKDDIKRLKEEFKIDDNQFKINPDDYK